MISESQNKTFPTPIRIIVVWLMLLILTLVSWLLGNQYVPGFIASMSTASILIISLIKVRIIMVEYMELSHAPKLLRVTIDLWLILLGGVMIYLTQ